MQTGGFLPLDTSQAIRGRQKAKKRPIFEERMHHMKETSRDTLG